MYGAIALCVLNVVGRSVVFLCGIVWHSVAPQPFSLTHTRTHILSPSSASPPLQPQMTLANGSSTSGGGVKGASPPLTGSGPTLIQFGSESDSDNEQGQPLGSNIRPPHAPPTISVPPPHKKSPFGDFDPWGPTATAHSMNLLDLEENLSPPSDSEHSEVRTVGTEAFKKKSTSLQSSPAPTPTFSNFDPFGERVGQAGDLFGNPVAFGHSGSSESLLKPTQQVGSSGGLLSPSVASNSSSAPNVSALGGGAGGRSASAFSPTLSDIPQSPKTGPHAGRSMSMQQGGSGGNHAFSSMSDGRTSPFGGPNLLSGNPSLGHHSSSTGHLQPQMDPGTVRGGMWGSNRADPFADLGNLKAGVGTNGGARAQQSAGKPSARPQSGPTMVSRPGYQYYNQKSSQPQSKQAGSSGQAVNKKSTGGSTQAGKASYQPNYSSSAVGERGERGLRAKTG